MGVPVDQGGQLCWLSRTLQRQQRGFVEPPHRKHGLDNFITPSLSPLPPSPSLLAPVTSRRLWRDSATMLVTSTPEVGQLGWKSHKHQRQDYWAAKSF